MTRWENYLASAEKIIHQYDGALPLHHFLKGYFKQHPYMGSRDRRWISQLVYQYYRLGYLWKEEKSVTERILLGAFLCGTADSELLAALQPALNAQVHLPPAAKLAAIAGHPHPPALQQIFPYTGHLSEGIDAAAFAASFLVQPDLFIRTRKNRQAAVIQLLEKAGIPFETPLPDAIALPNSTKIDSIITDKSWYEIQDISSQQAGRLFHPEAGEQWWDCCAASGGKAILLVDRQPAVKLLVSDVRPSILQNLHQRFKEAGIRNYESMVLDLAAPVTGSAIGHRRFDHIILDAPCSGSGTWARTPENLSFFKETQIDTYQQLQKRIAGNVIQLLKPGGTLTYITCSVFREENEAVIAYLEDSTALRRQEGGVIPGYAHRADSMFAVQMKKNS